MRDRVALTRNVPHSQCPLSPWEKARTRVARRQVFGLPRQGGYSVPDGIGGPGVGVLAVESQRLPEADLDCAPPGITPALGHHVVGALQVDRDHGQPQLHRQQADTALERQDGAVVRPHALGEIEQRPPISGQPPAVLQTAAHRASLGEREGVGHQNRYETLHPATLVQHLIGRRRGQDAAASAKAGRLSPPGCPTGSGGWRRTAPVPEFGAGVPARVPGGGTGGRARVGAATPEARPGAESPAWSRATVRPLYVRPDGLLPLA